MSKWVEHVLVLQGQKWRKKSRATGSGARYVEKLWRHECRAPKQSHMATHAATHVVWTVLRTVRWSVAIANVCVSAYALGVNEG